MEPVCRCFVATQLRANIGSSSSSTLLKVLARNNVDYIQAVKRVYLWLYVACSRQSSVGCVSYLAS